MPLHPMSRYNQSHPDCIVCQRTIHEITRPTWQYRHKKKDDGTIDMWRALVTPNVDHEIKWELYGNFYYDEKTGVLTETKRG